MNNFTGIAAAKRLGACILGGLVLGLMVGHQEGTQSDFGVSFKEALIHNGRGLIFVVIGLVLFVVVTFAPLLARYVRRPGAIGVAAGFLLVLIGMVLMNWFDPVGKFKALSSQVSNTSGLSFPANTFFGWLAWTLWIACLVLGVAAIVTRIAAVAWGLTVVAVLSGLAAYIGHDQVVNFASNLGPDHSLGVYMTTIGYAVFAGTGIVIARSQAEIANPRAFIEDVLAWRPGFPLAVVATVLSLIALINAAWFAPTQINLDLRGVKSEFNGEGLPSLAWAYVAWLGFVLAAVTCVAALVGTYLRHRLIAVVAAVLGLVGLVLTFYSMYEIASIGHSAAPQFGKLWQNLGSGGWVQLIAYGLLLIGGVIAVRPARTPAPAAAEPDGGVGKLPFHAARTKMSDSPSGRMVLPLALVIALFYPPTLTGEWQNTIVTQIGPYLLLAVGLNVVVGWAGLLDLGYIAFYAVGAYMTAYITGSLPVKPPSFLHLSPLWAIPFAIAAALLAGILLGAPTLRLRGDYLAIVTLGFGEIIQQVAINNPGGFTGGASGPNVPNPVLKLGLFSVHWGLDNLPYWYLLLAFLIIVVILFYRLEGSRLGRAWAAIREDEVAAQATGVNTTRVKLLAFGIGASTSGLAGVFFATQVGYFDPTLFTLQNSILIVAYVVFGGMGSLPGALVGAAVLTWLPVFLKDQVPQQDRQMWIGALVLAMMIFRPAGLIPAKRRAAELEGFDHPASSEVSAVPLSEGL